MRKIKIKIYFNTNLKELNKFIMIFYHLLDQYQNSLNKENNTFLIILKIIFQLISTNLQNQLKNYGLIFLIKRNQINIHYSNKNTSYMQKKSIYTILNMNILKILNFKIWKKKNHKCHHIMITSTLQNYLVQEKILLLNKLFNL